MLPAAFLDRDGTINEEVHYLSDPSDFRLLPRVADAIRLLNYEGWLVVVVTNQSGIARGYFDVGILDSIHGKMKKQLAEAGCQIDKIYYCPHHPDAKCRCRKPNPGLYQQAANELGINLKKSVIIGDKISDLLPGPGLGCRTALILTGHGRQQLESGMLKGFHPDLISGDLCSAVTTFLDVI